ncbi:MAG: PKD domain-containing protein [Flavobacteriales bacterium]|nr:PKD domain-containing protein [Flavobacteriales bacterium]
MATLTALNPDGATITWSGGITDGVGFIPPLGTSTYIVEGDLLGCITPDAVTITVNPLPTIGAGIDRTICEGFETVLNGTGAGDGGSYVWTGGASDGVSFEPPVGSTTYTVTGTDANGCQNTDEVIVHVNPLPLISFIADETLGCEPLTVEFTNTTDLPGVSCEWWFSDGNTASGCSSVINKFKTDGFYDVTLTVTTADGCIDTVTYSNYIEVVPFPIPAFGYSDQEVTIVDPNVQFVNNSLYSTEYLWSFGDGTPTSDLESPSHTFPDVPNVAYPVTLTVWNELGCTDSLTKLIIVNDVITFYIPNVFTPDGDDYNETFQPVFYSGYDPYDFNMKIYNRYGEIVFETFNAAVGWDGTYGTRGLVNEGVYTWSIEFRETMSDKRHKHKGHVTILK